MEPVVAVVLPSLNEETTLLETCKSLGFYKSATGQQAPGTLLFIIDNGSSDRTLEVAREVQINSTRGSVFVGQEKERGYVPPRHTGNSMAKVFAEHSSIDPSDILILQADADTIYREGYVEWMRRASQAYGSNFLLEGLAEFSQKFCYTFPRYVQLSAEIDTRVFSLLQLPETSTLVCTDAVCGYRLSDYFAWGGHLREYRDQKNEIHAETTRLYMRALAHGARKIYVNEALAHPDERKIISRPIEEFATAGFPREASWRALWQGQYHNSISIEDFGTHLDHPIVLHAINVRERHLAALFGLLPVHVARALGESLDLPAKTALGHIAASLPKHDKEALARYPGAFLIDVLNVVDHHENVLSDFLAGRSSTEY